MLTNIRCILVFIACSSWFSSCSSIPPYYGYHKDLKQDFNLVYFQPFHKILKELKRLSKSKNEDTSQRTLFYIGKTFEGRKIPALKIQDSKSNDDVVKKKIVVDCGAHAREWVSIATCMNLIIKLSHNCCPDLLSKYDWVIIPVLNPDGYVYTWKNRTTRMWRKNRSYTSDQLKIYHANGNNDSCIGVDINRNFDSHWGTVRAPTVNPCFEMYAGHSAFSEKESKALSKYLKKNKNEIIAYVSLHNYGQAWMTPFGHTKEKPERFNEMKRVATLAAKSMKKYSGVQYRVGSTHDQLYPNSGGSIDWAYATLSIPYTYIIEMAPGRNADFDAAFLAPPSMMVKNSDEIFVGIQTMARKLKDINNEQFRYYRDTRDQT